MKSISLASFCLIAVMNTAVAAGKDYVIKNAIDDQAEKYLVEKVNIRTFSERFKPFASYWGVRENDIPARMTFRFPLEKPLKSGQLYANLITVNSENNKSYGSGVGRGSLWCSADGRNWQLLLDAPPPEKRFLQGYDYHKSLPPELTGSTEVWLQVRLFATGMKDSTYSVAQFARKAVDDPHSNVLLLRVKYDEPPAKVSTEQKPDPRSK